MSQIPQNDKNNNKSSNKTNYKKNYKKNNRTKYAFREILAAANNFYSKQNPNRLLSTSSSTTTRSFPSNINPSLSLPLPSYMQNITPEDNENNEEKVDEFVNEFCILFFFLFSNLYFIFFFILNFLILESKLFQLSQ